MNLTRRAFLSASSVAVAATLGDVAAAPALASAGSGLRRSRFAPLVGRTFVASSGTRRVRLRLAHVRDVLGAPRGSDTSFTLQFRSRRALPDGIYTVSHRRAGTHALFLSGVGTGAHRYHEAVVNQAHAPRA